MYGLQNKYLDNGLFDYKLKTPEDILKVYSIDVKQLKGYEGLNESNKLLYEKFIVNLFNAFGLESRSTMVPKAIYFAEHTEFLGKERPEDDWYIIKGSVVKAIDKDGNKILKRTWKAKEYEHIKVEKQEVESYLRFEYKHQGRLSWLHVVGENTWY